jgi:hypothetical protein
MTCDNVNCIDVDDASWEGKRYSCKMGTIGKLNSLVPYWRLSKLSLSTFGIPNVFATCLSLCNVTAV